MKKLTFQAASEGLATVPFDIEITEEEYDDFKAYLRKHGDSLIELENEMPSLFEAINEASMEAYEPIVREFLREDAEDMGEEYDEDEDIDWSEWAPSMILLPEGLLKEAQK